jgi:3-hydroxy-3-methylglutaryl CoA synthase
VGINQKKGGKKMVGIVSYGGYIPWYRINRGILYSAMGWLNPASFLPGEKSVINYDEDSITMAVAASMDCLTEIDRKNIDCLFFATTTSPYKERQDAGIISTALDLKNEIRTADFTNSLKSATTALISAYEAIKAGSAKNVLVCSADTRTGKLGGYQEEMYGDGAGALLLGDENIVATLDGYYSISYDLVDHWRSETDTFDRTWEDRWIRDEGYEKFIIESISGLAKKYNLSVKDIAKVVYPCMYSRAHSTIAKKLGFSPSQVQPHLFEMIGNTGTPYPIMLLISALEEAKPSDKIIMASFGNGSDALLFTVTEEIERIRGKRRGIKKHLLSKRDLSSYEKYVNFRNLVPIEAGFRGETTAPTSISTMWRHRKEILALIGSKCKRCGTPQYPPQKICANPQCGAEKEMEEYRFSDKKGTVFSYTEDLLAFSPNPPAIYGIVDFEGGGRGIFDFTDCERGDVKVNMRVEMSFRRKFIDQFRGISGYFWKATPREIK